MLWFCWLFIIGSSSFSRYSLKKCALIILIPWFDFDWHTEWRGEEILQYLQSYFCVTVLTMLIYVCCICMCIDLCVYGIISRERTCHANLHTPQKNRKETLLNKRRFIQFKPQINRRIPIYMFIFLFWYFSNDML